MSVLEDFLSSYRSGGLVFFVGAGASFHSHAPSPIAFTTWTSKLFLPQDDDLERERDLVLNRSSVPGSYFSGIQPEVFYEHLLTLCPDLEALGLWRALSPVWLAKQMQALRPNPNHQALARYAERTGLPVFTTNFDTLIETAAVSSSPRPPRVLLPGDPEEKAAARRYAQGVLDPGRLSLFKVHGSIMVNGEERLDSLATTMTAITARNRQALAALEAVLRGRRLVLLGYSGSDIDFFPSLLSMAPRAPFWFDPRKGDDKITADHLGRLGAVALRCDPADVLADLEDLLRSRPPEIEFEPLFETLAVEMKVSLSRPQKLLLLGMCLHSVGYNIEASALFTNRLAREALGLSTQDQILANLIQSRIADTTSQYDLAEASARAALGMIAEAGRSLPSRRALKTRALYHLDQARQQTIGPMIRFGDSRVDWRPPTSVLVRSLLASLWIALRLIWLTFPLRGRLRPTIAGNAMEVRAVHAANDHLVMMFGRVVSAVGARARRAPLRGLLRRGAEWLKVYADRSGDFFSYAGAEKYADRLSGRPEHDAVRTFQLLRDPLNFALARRDQAMEALESERGREGADFSVAAALFDDARGAAHDCGSHATEVKALAGLVACGTELDDLRSEIDEVTGKIQGAGYAAYRAFVLSLASASG